MESCLFTLINVTQSKCLFKSRFYHDYRNLFVYFTFQKTCLSQIYFVKTQRWIICQESVIHVNIAKHLHLLVIIKHFVLYVAIILVNMNRYSLIKKIYTDINKYLL